MLFISRFFSVALEQQLSMYFLSSSVLTGDGYVRLALVAFDTNPFLLRFYPHPSADSGFGIRSVRRSNLQSTHWPSVNRKLFTCMSFFEQKLLRSVIKKINNLSQSSTSVPLSDSKPGHIRMRIGPIHFMCVFKILFYVIFFLECSISFYFFIGINLLYMLLQFLLWWWLSH